MGVNSKYINEILDDVECYKLVLQRQIKRFPRGFWAKPWSLQSAREIIRYLLEERLHYSREDICKKLKKSTFEDNKLGGMLVLLFDNSTYKALNNTYPNEFQPWELSSTPNNFWDDKQNIVKAVRWLVETKLDNNRQRVCKEFNRGTLEDNGLAFLPNKLGVYNVLDMAYPNQFKPWELIQVSSTFWKDTENVKEAVRWLVKTKLNNNRQRILKEFNSEFVCKNGFSAVLTRYGIYGMLNIAYPNEFKPWELACVGRNYWNSTNNIKSALKEFVDKEFNGDKVKASKELTVQLLKDNRLNTIVYKFGIEQVREMIKAL